MDTFLRTEEELEERYRTSHLGYRQDTLLEVVLDIKKIQDKSYLIQVGYIDRGYTNIEYDKDTRLFNSDKVRIHLYRL